MMIKFFLYFCHNFFIYLALYAILHFYNVPAYLSIFLTYSYKKQKTEDIILGARIKCFCKLRLCASEKKRMKACSAHGRFFSSTHDYGSSCWLIQNKHSYIRVCELRRVSIESSVGKLLAEFFVLSSQSSIVKWILIALLYLAIMFGRWRSRKMQENLFYCLFS